MPRTSVSAITRHQTLGEEIANSLSHGFGLLLAIAALPILVIHAQHVGGISAIVGAAIFGSSAVLLYLASTLYHAISHQRLKAIFRALDHAAIYLLIAGTYTPITLGVLHGGWGWTMLGVIWSLALAGLVFKAMVGPRFPRVSTLMYVAMGWVVMIAIRPLWLHMSANGLLWLGAGGLAYTLGVVFFVLDGRIRYSHFIWHLFVLAGTTCHFFAVLLYAF
ncbi:MULTISPECIES: hemolysin III family protein [unclassified Rhodanobacter]|uniref:PAQR family membrane homeostasis protein TrhA n=1 Tax=unclassified Rhodanobacter TaxID=2621553 RepID=UPI0009863E8E|nr:MULTISPECIES: hemolysin III family protein [unclassified Rhodanobacter]OOG38559.1 hemolysin D [Rhodanobacter sp. C05]OOG50102.1 hemolysin D [Rhodanobacter sp. C01]OOG52289.1 hemolysin D [Rhodanobacter sp. C03]OOG65981.1 hemolysin D [Rhodanobacter sp. B04]